MDRGERFAPARAACNARRASAAAIAARRTPSGSARRRFAVRSARQLATQLPNQSRNASARGAEAREIAAREPMPRQQVERQWQFAVAQRVRQRSRFAQRARQRERAATAARVRAEQGAASMRRSARRDARSCQATRPYRPQAPDRAAPARRRSTACQRAVRIAAVGDARRQRCVSGCLASPLLVRAQFLGPPLQLDRRGLRFADAECGMLDLEHETRERAARDRVRSFSERNARPNSGCASIHFASKLASGVPVDSACSPSPSARGRSAGASTT